MVIETIDYNGPDAWTAEHVRQRYLELASRLGLLSPLDLRPAEHTAGDRTWRYPVMDTVIAAAKDGDGACVELLVQFVESGHQQAFGRILHANAARSLRRADLTDLQSSRLRRRILAMLVEGQVPHEFHEYAKLLRKVGLGDDWPGTRLAIDESNRYVMRYVRYFERHALEQRRA